MNNKDSFDQLFDEWMAPQKIEDAGFSQRVLNSLETQKPQFSWNLVFLCLSLMVGFFYYQWDVIIFRQYLTGVKFMTILTQVEISEFSVSLSQSSVIAISALFAYVIYQQFLRLIKDI